MAVFRFVYGIALLVGFSNAQEIINGQIHTPGIAIVNAPQPNTPLGGDVLHISLDVTSNGQLQLPPYPNDSPTAIHNITIFLSSYDTGRNFTVTDVTANAFDATPRDIMLQEEGITVKHVNWIWPDCLVGDGRPTNNDSDRGLYNISIRQNFRINGEEKYTIFDLPIQVTNSIPASEDRPPCDALNNPLLDEAELISSASGFSRLPGSPLETKQGNGAGFLNGAIGAHWVWAIAFGFFVL